jgi:hypothetical protein
VGNHTTIGAIMNIADRGSPPTPCSLPAGANHEAGRGRRCGDGSNPSRYSSVASDGVGGSNRGVGSSTVSLEDIRRLLIVL